MKKTVLSLILLAIGIVSMAQVPSGTPGSSLTAYYNFNTNSDDQWLDRDLTWGGTPGYAEDRWGNINGAAAFNLNNFLQDSDFPFPTGDFTVAFWLYSEVNQSGQGRTTVEIDESIFIRYSGSQSFLQGLAGFFVPANSDYVLFNAGSFSNPTNAWHHVVLTNDAVNGSRVYVDNVFFAGGSALGGAASATPGMGLTVGTGTSAGTENPDKRWNGRVDDLYIYNRGLTEQEVSDLYNQANDGGGVSTPPTPCVVGNVLINNGHIFCPINDPTLIIENGTASVETGGLYTWTLTPAGGGNSVVSTWAEPFNYTPGANAPVGDYVFTFRALDANGTVCDEEAVNVTFQTAQDAACEQFFCTANAGTLTDTELNICPDDDVTTLIVPGSQEDCDAFFNNVRFQSAGGTGGVPGGVFTVALAPPYVLNDVQPLLVNASYPELEGAWNVSVELLDIDQNLLASSSTVLVNFLDAQDPICTGVNPNCTAGTFAIGNGQVICPQVSVQAVVFGSGDPGPGGTLTYTLVPLEGQLALSEATFTNTFELNALMAGPGGVSGQYDLVVRAYADGATTPCDEMSITVEFLPETDVACICEIGTLLVNNGTVICPGETVTILTGNVQIPADRELSFEIYDYPDFNIYYEEQSPFEAPYTFTHDGTYFGDAVFYVYTYGTGPAAPPVDLHTRGGGGGDICGFYEVFVTLAESTDAACLGVGVDEMDLTEETIYPNPTSGELYFSSPTSGLVLDVTGKELMTFSKRIAIDLSRFPTGMYVVKTEGGTVHRVFRK